ncbi:MAG: DUF3098 domain-containing protein [Chitinophagaceae bacterium]|nr:DUF3098 domain-containing protein [Chitinophagaceae bacterium]
MKNDNKPNPHKTEVSKTIKPGINAGAAQVNKTAPSKVKTANTKTPFHLFSKDNYKWMIIGLIVMAIGFVLMAGGKSPDSNVFNDKDVYSPMRITVAPILIIAGLLLEIFAIMKKPPESVKE